MKKIFCFYVNNCPFVVKVSMEGKHSFDYECLYPFTGIKSTYFNEEFDFFKRQGLIKICIESVFHTIQHLKETESESSKSRISYLKNLEGLHSVVLSKDLYETIQNNILANNQLTYIKKIDCAEEIIYLYEIIFNSTIKKVNFYTDADIHLASENLEEMKIANYKEWLRQCVTCFYFIRNHSKEPTDTFRNRLFWKMASQKKLSMLQKKINSNNESYFDDLLQIWWQNRY